MLVGFFDFRFFFSFLELMWWRLFARWQQGTIGAYSILVRFLVEFSVFLFHFFFSCFSTLVRFWFPTTLNINFWGEQRKFHYSVSVWPPRAYQVPGEYNGANLRMGDAIIRKMFRSRAAFAARETRLRPRMLSCAARCATPALARESVPEKEFPEQKIISIIPLLNENTFQRN